jgi:plasmid stabilization system protein ParE
MKRYAVVLEESAQSDVRESYDWGRRAWGKHEAQQWVRQLRKAVTNQLAVVPKAFPLAPEDEMTLLVDILRVNDSPPPWRTRWLHGVRTCSHMAGICGRVPASMCL